MIIDTKIQFFKALKAKVNFTIVVEDRKIIISNKYQQVQNVSKFTERQLWNKQKTCPPYTGQIPANC